MILCRIILGYAIIHMISVIHMFNVFDKEGYIPDDYDRWTVWLFAPILIIMTLIRMLGGR